MVAISQNAISAQTNWSLKKRSKTEDEYFDEEEEQLKSASALEYIPGKSHI